MALGAKFCRDVTYSSSNGSVPGGPPVDLFSGVRRSNAIEQVSGHCAPMVD